MRVRRGVELPKKEKFSCGWRVVGMRPYECAPSVNIKILAMRLAVSVKCCTSSGFKERPRMSLSR